MDFDDLNYPPPEDDPGEAAFGCLLWVLLGVGVLLAMGVL